MLTMHVFIFVGEQRDRQSGAIDEYGENRGRIEIIYLTMQSSCKQHQAIATFVDP